MSEANGQHGPSGRPRKVVGRHDKLTPEIQQTIVECLQAGNYLETSAAYANVTKKTLYDWMKRGNRQKRGKFRTFLNAIKKAIASAEVQSVATIAKASKTQWQAAAWRLERKDYKKWGRKDRVDSQITGTDKGPLQIEVVETLVTSHADAANLLAALRGSSCIPESNGKP